MKAYLKEIRNLSHIYTSSILHPISIKEMDTADLELDFAEAISDL